MSQRTDTPRSRTAFQTWLLTFDAVDDYEFATYFDIDPDTGLYMDPHVQRSWAAWQAAENQPGPTTSPAEADDWYERERAAFIAWWESQGQKKFSDTPTLAAGAGWFARAEQAASSEKKACPVGSNPLDCSTRSCDACFRLDATKYHETASSALVDGDLATQRDISDRCVPSATNAPPIPETSQEVHDTLIDAERYRWFRNECDWERRIVIAEYAEDGGQLDHHIDKARCGL